MSGYDEREALQHFAGLAHNGFLQKPFTPETLIARVAALFGL